MVTTHIFRKE